VKRRWLGAWALAVALLLGACGGGAPDLSVQGVSLSLESSAFADGEAIPLRYTCDGEDLSPPLAWGEPPAGTLSLALIADDPDAPVGTWVHWVLFNLPADTRSLPEGLLPEAAVAGGLQGINGWKELGYGGPCPPKGSTHRYFFKLYALDTALDLEAGASKADVEKAMDGHILGQGQLVGRYGRQ
jgi:Raf kinase inhibitor-like YbhB/YbcL family protein